MKTDSFDSNLEIMSRLQHEPEWRQEELTGKVLEVEKGRSTSSLSEKGTMDLQSAERFIPWNCPKQPNLVCAVALS